MINAPILDKGDQNHFSISFTYELIIIYAN